MSSMPKQDVAKVAGAVVLLLVAVVFIFRFYMSQQVHVAVQVNVPQGSSEKGQAMKAQQNGEKGQENSPKGEDSGGGVSDNIDPTKVNR